MRKRIVADSSCGISIEEGKKIGVEILPLIINFGKESYRDILDINKSERHIRGGMATRQKYLLLHRVN